MIGAAGVLVGGYGAFLAIAPLAGSWRTLITFAAWFGVPAVLSDLLLIPVLAGIGALVLRLPPAVRLPASVGLILTGTLLAIGWPFLGKPGLRPDNPSLLDRNYLVGSAVALGVVWAAMAGWALVRARRGRRAPR